MPLVNLLVTCAIIGLLPAWIASSKGCGMWRSTVAASLLCHPGITTT